jgi:hypothetical protein
MIILNISYLKFNLKKCLPFIQFLGEIICKVIVELHLPNNSESTKLNMFTYNKILFEVCTKSFAFEISKNSKGFNF